MWEHNSQSIQTEALQNIFPQNLSGTIMKLQTLN